MGNGLHGDKWDDPAKESTHTSKKGEGSSFPHTGTFVAPCQSSNIIFQTQPWQSCPCSLCLHGMELLSSDGSVSWPIFSRNAKEAGRSSAGSVTGFAPDRTCFNQLMGLPAPLIWWEKRKDQEHQPTHSFLLPTYKDISGTFEDIFIYPLLLLCLLPALPGCPPEIREEETDREKKYSFFHLYICFQHLP